MTTLVSSDTGTPVTRGPVKQTEGRASIGSRVLELTEKDFRRIRTLVYDRFGISLSDAKRTLVQGRLHKTVRQQGFRTFTEYTDDLEQNTNTQRLLSLVDQISTNHSYFFREADHFEYLASTIVPELQDRGVRPRDLRIWSAGSSEGQEPYTLAMVLHNRFGGFNEDSGILATDISVTALQKSIAAVYPREVLRSVPDQYKKYFHHINDEQVRVVEAIRASILFKRLNLIQDRFPFRNQFHIVLCRNVMIYFDAGTKQALVSRFAECLANGGYLLIGHSETLGRGVRGFRYLKPTVYQRWQ